MATRRSYSKWALIAISGGAALTTIEVYGAVSFLVSQGQPHYLVAGGAVVTLVAAVLPILAARCWQAGRFALAVMLYAAMVPALSVIVCAAVERTGSANDGAERGRQEVAQKIALARESVKDAKAEVEAAEAKAVAECLRAPKGVDPNGPRCNSAKTLAERSQSRLTSARDELAKAGVVPKDPMASRIAAVLPIPEEAVRIYQPLVLPLSISALGLLLITAAAHPTKRRKAPKRKGKRKKKPRLGNRAKLPKPLPENVVALRRK